MRAFMSVRGSRSGSHADVKESIFEARRILAETEPSGCYVPLDWLPQHGTEEQAALTDALRAFVEDE